MTASFFRSSVRGAGHIRKNIPCEDSFLIIETENGTAFAVADGHGDSNCPRSAKGAAIACEIGCAALKDFAEMYLSGTVSADTGRKTDLNTITDPDTETTVEAKTGQGIRTEEIRKLASRIVEGWKEQVLKDLEASPLTREESSACDRYLMYYQEGQYLEHIYGTTLMAGILTDQYFFAIQQGDGRCTVFDYEGNVSQPIPWDERCIANITTSLCNSDAAESFRWHLQDLQTDPVSAVILSSDGLEDSFGYMEEMYSWERSMLIFAAVSTQEELEQKLLEVLPELSESGSRDDITICGFFDRNRLEQLKEKLETENQKIRISLQIEMLNSRLQSMEAKMEYLKKQYETALSGDTPDPEVIKASEAEYLDYRKKQQNYLQEKENLKEKLENLS